MSRIIIKKGHELYIRNKRFKVLDTNIYQGKYRYIVQEIDTGRITAMDRDVAIAARELQLERMAKGLSPMPQRRKRTEKPRLAIPMLTDASSV